MRFTLILNLIFVLKLYSLPIESNSYFKDISEESLLTYHFNIPSESSGDMLEIAQEFIEECFLEFESKIHNFINNLDSSNANEMYARNILINAVLHYKNDRINIRDLLMDLKEFLSRNPIENLSLKDIDDLISIIL